LAIAGVAAIACGSFRVDGYLKFAGGLSAVLGLLTTAIDLYLFRVDSSRTQVETAQLARTLLNQMASDLRAARFFDPAASASSEPSDGTDGSSTTVDVADSGMVLGIFGSATELRIDRSAVYQWEAQARLADAENNSADTNPAPDPTSMPQTVRYLFNDDKELLTADLAATGVSTDPVAAGYAGLYREQVSTAGWQFESASSDGVSDSGGIGNAELIAPEVVEIEILYFDGEQLVSEWDSALEQGLPKAVEIRLVLLEEPFEQAVTRTPSDRVELRRSSENLAEYRMVVGLNNIEEANSADFPTPVEVESDFPEE